MQQRLACAILILTPAPVAATVSIEVLRVAVAAAGDESASITLFESADRIELEVKAPTSADPSVQIDADRNGKVDPDVDFMVAYASDGSPCLSTLLADGSSTTCKPLGNKAQIKRTTAADVATTLITLPKPAISTDGFGFGFSISIWNRAGNYTAKLAAGDYLFGGKLQLLEHHTNFTGQKSTAVPPEMLPAIRSYQGCISTGVQALDPIDRSKLQALKALPTSCREINKAPLARAVDDLIASGADRSRASAAVQGIVDQIDAGHSRLIRVVEQGAPVLQ